MRNYLNLLGCSFYSVRLIYGLGFVWMFALSVLTIKEVGEVSWHKSVFIVLISIALTMGFYITFIR